MSGKVEGRIIALLFESYPEALTIRQIAERLKKAYPHVHAVTTALLGEGLLTKTVVGNAYACTVNLSNEKAQASLAILEYDKARQAIRAKKVPASVAEFARRASESARNPDASIILLSDGVVSCVVGQDTVKGALQIPAGVRRLERNDAVAALARGDIALSNLVVLTGTMAFSQLFCESMASRGLRK